MKRKLLLSIMALVPAALLPLAAAGQVAPATAKTGPEAGEHTYKYAVFAGYGYTSLNQVNQSRSGLQGGTFSVTRDFGQYFGVAVDGGFYSVGSGSPVGTTSAAKPSVDMVLAGPVLHAPLYEHVSGFVHVLLGGEHTGGASEKPNISFATGFGVGLDYNLSPRLALRAGGDDISSSFVQDPNHLGYSPHQHWNARASVGVVYKF